MLDQDFGLEVKTRGKSDIFMRWPGITVDTAVFAAAIGVNAHLEADVRAIVCGDDRARSVGQEFCFGPPQCGEIFLVFLDLVQLELVMGRFKPVRWVLPSAASFRRRNGWIIHFDNHLLSPAGNHFAETVSPPLYCTRAQKPNWIV
jgi:hypothetical protein